MRLDRFQNHGFQRGRSRLTEALWLLLQGLLVESWLPGSAHRIAILKLFGAKIGRGVVIKPRVRVKFPWRLQIGDYSWIGEGVWIDNLAEVTIGSHCCISQGAYLCTGSHDWSLETFDLITRPIIVEDHVWLCARCSVGPGVRVRQGAVLTLGSTAVSELASWQIHSGIPAVSIRSRLETPGEAQRTAGNPGRMVRG